MESIFASIALPKSSVPRIKLAEDEEETPIPEDDVSTIGDGVCAKIKQDEPRIARRVQQIRFKRKPLLERNLVKSKFES
jgi:hypothetical protein